MNQKIQNQNSKPQREKLYAVLIDAFWGGLIIALVTFVAMYANTYALYFLLSIPGDLLYPHIYGRPMSANPFDWSVAYYAYCAAVNGFFGILMFASVSAFMRFIVKAEKKN